MPPTNFLPLVDRKCKEFLWGSTTAKISHHSIIGDTARGGMRYKDLQNFILSINLKFYLNYGKNLGIYFDSSLFLFGLTKNKLTL